MNCRQHLINVAIDTSGRITPVICNGVIPDDGPCPQFRDHAAYEITAKNNRFYIKYWPLQLGNAITLPWKRKTYVIFKSPNHVTERTAAHEIVHVDQLARMGAVWYLWTHVWARIVTRNIWGRGHWIEEEAYVEPD